MPRRRAGECLLGPEGGTGYEAGREHDLHEMREVTGRVAEARVARRQEGRQSRRLVGAVVKRQTRGRRRGGRLERRDGRRGRATRNQSNSRFPVMRISAVDLHETEPRVTFCA